MSVPFQLTVPLGTPAAAPKDQPLLRRLPAAVAELIEAAREGGSMVIEEDEAEALRAWAAQSGAVLRPYSDQEWRDLVMDLRLAAPWGLWTGVDWSMVSGGVELNGLRSWAEGVPEDIHSLLLDAATDPGMAGYPEAWIDQFQGQNRRLIGGCLASIAHQPLEEALRAVMHAYRRCFGILAAVERAASQAEILAGKALNALQAHRLKDALALIAEVEMLEALARDLDSWPGPWTPWAERVRNALGRAAAVAAAGQESGPADEAIP